MEWNSQIAIFLFFLVPCIIWIFWKRIRNLPPGPLGLPIVGYAPFMGKYPYVTMMDLAKRYGSVFTLPMGCTNVLTLNDWGAVKETLVDKAEVFSGRPHQNTFFKDTVDNLDIASSSGSQWREKRRFALHHLRDLGFGRRSMEEIIIGEVHQIIHRLESNPVADICGYFFFSFMNIIWSVVGDKSFEPQDSYMQEFSQILKIMFREFRNDNPVTFLPVLRVIPGISFHAALKATARLHKFLDDEIDEHINTYQTGHQRDFIDVYLKEIFRHEESHLKTKSFTRRNLRGVLRNLFSAGIDTGSNTLSWALLYMITWPEIQSKVQMELDDVIGRTRLPTYSDKQLLPYTEAVILEVHRYASIVPLSVPHSTTSATRVRNFNIPKDTHVLENIWAVHHDPKLWGDPDVFRPERFLNDSGRVQKPEYLIPFSVGSRYCLGEPLARMEIFLFFTSLLHKFSFSKTVGVPPPSLAPIVDLTLSPLPFTLIAKARQ